VKDSSSRSLSAKFSMMDSGSTFLETGTRSLFGDSTSEYLNTHVTHFRDRNDIQAWIPTLHLRAGIKASNFDCVLSVLIEAVPKC
jgi:hypothetical protein